MPIVLIKVSLTGFSNSNSTHPWYSHYNAFDGSEESWWESGSACYPNHPIYLSYSWTTGPCLVTRYRLYLDAARRPIDWKFQGSNDDDIWDDLDIQTSQTGDRFEWKSYDINNDRYYLHYRIICYVGASYDYPIRIYEIELWADESTVTTTTSSSTSSTTGTTTASTLSTTITTKTSSTSTVTSTTATGPPITFATTPPPDVERLWPMEEELSIVRSNFNEWYNRGIPLGVKRVESVPPWLPEYEGSMIYSDSSHQYYLATNVRWEVQNIGSVPHAVQHSSDMPDELFHIGPSSPDVPFTGKVWLDVTQSLTTTTTATTSSTLSTTSTLTTITQSTTASTTISSSTYTYTTTTTYSTSTSSTTTLQSPENVAINGSVSADSWEIGYEAQKAFDGLSSTAWLTNVYQDHFPHWVKYSLKTPAVVHTYSILWNSQKYAYSWYFEGSNNAYIWDTLDFIQSHSPFPGVNYYHINNTQVYKHYKFRFLSGVDTIHSSLSIYEIKLYAGGIATSTSTSSSTTTTLSSTTTTTATTISSSTQLVYGFLSTGGIVVAGNEYINYPASNAFDNSNTTFWICDVVSGPPYWIMYYWPSSSYIVNRYVLHISTPGRPKSWKFQGSENGTVWIDLDIRTDIFEEGELDLIFNNSTFYSYYRLLISETHSTGYAVRVGNIEFYGYRSELSTTSTTTTSTTTTTTTTTSTITTTVSTTSGTTVYVPLDQRFLMNFNGDDNSVSTIDDTGRHGSIIWNKDAKIKTAKAMFGVSSLYNPSDSYYPSSSESYITVPSSSDWRLGGGRGNFSIDFWMYIEKYQFLWRNWNTIVSCVDSVDTYWAIRYYPEGELVNFSLRENGVLKINYSSRLVWSFGQWGHIALTRIGNIFKFYYQGISLGNGEIFDVEFPFLTGPLLIGRGPSEYLNTQLDFNQGTFWLDSLRIYLGSLFTGNFEIPTQPTTSTTISTTASSTTLYQIPDYTVKLSLPCNDSGFSLYDTSGRHGVVVLSTDTVFTTQFRSSATQLINPMFGTVFFSSHKYPLDLTNQESGWITYANHNDWKLGGSGDFTIEGWIVYKNTQFRYGSPIMSYYQDSENFWVIYINQDQKKFYFKVRVGGVFTVNYISTANVQENSWNYFCLVRSQRRFRLFWNGSPGGDWSEVMVDPLTTLDGNLILFGGPSITNYSQVVSSGIASNGLRISEGIVTGADQGLVPNHQF